MLATLTDEPFDDPAWIFETKWDGFRLVAWVKRGKASLFSRRLLDISHKYPTICSALARTGHEAVFDGELVAIDAKGRSRFQLLQNADRDGANLLYCAFDLLYLDGKDLRSRPLLERKETLEAVLPADPHLLFSTHVVGHGIRAFCRAERAGEEGVIAKLSSSRYHSGERTREWLKVKASQEQEVVIVGFTAPRGSRRFFGSLLLAVREGNAWVYVGRAGSGFTADRLRELHEKFVKLITDKKLVTAKVPSAAATTWLKPKLVAQVKFTEWTSAGEMRHPVFLGLRTDKKAVDVVRELPTPIKPKRRER